MLAVVGVVKQLSCSWVWFNDRSFKK